MAKASPIDVPPNLDTINFITTPQNTRWIKPMDKTEGEIREEEWVMSRGRKVQWRPQKLIPKLSTR
jgi:hypothetical protein